MRLLPLVAAIALLAGCDSPIPSPVPTPAPTPVATSTPAIWNGPTLYGLQAWTAAWPAVSPTQLRAIASSRVKMVRLPIIPWNTPLNANKTWNFAALDALYAEDEALGLTPLFTVANPRSTADIGTTTAYLAIASGRYRDALLELGNEPDSCAPTGWPAFCGQTAAQYAVYALKWAAAWKSGSPNAQIATGGTASLDVTWQKGLLAAKVLAPGSPITALAVHPYGEIVTPQPGVTGGNLGTDLGALKKLCNCQIWLTEYGEPNPTPTYVVAYFSAVKAMHVPVASYFEGCDQAGAYGILDTSCSLKPIVPPATTDPYTALQTFFGTP